MDKTHFSRFFLEFSEFNYILTSGAFPCWFLFRKESFKYMGRFMNPLHRHYLKKIFRIQILRRVLKIERFFLCANLILLPALYSKNTVNTFAFLMIYLQRKHQRHRLRGVFGGFDPFIQSVLFMEPATFSCTWGTHP